MNSSFAGTADRRPNPLSTPFRIGTVTVPNRVVLAPMAGITSSAFRRHMKDHGAGLVTTEMVSAHGLVYRNRRTWEYLRFAEEERPVAVQLFGDGPSVMAAAVALALERGCRPDIFDVNMGCPVRKVVKTGAGCALLGDLDRAEAVARAVTREAEGSGIPVTVKMRTGLTPGRPVAVELARRLESVGIAALTMHPRAASQYYRGRADHTVTRQVAEAVGIPVIASGDVTSVAGGQSAIESTGASAVAVARGMLGNPWLLDGLSRGIEVEKPPLPEIVADLRSLLRAAAEEMGDERAALWGRKLVGWYLHGVGVPAPEVETLRRHAHVGDMDEALAGLVDRLAPRHPSVVANGDVSVDKRHRRSL